MEAPEDPAPRQEPRTEHAGGVLGVSVGLALLLGLVLGVLWHLRPALDGEDLLAEILPGEPRPFGLELVGAARLPTGERLIRLTATEETGEAGDPEPAPEEVIFVLYPRADAVSEVFFGGRGKEEERRGDPGTERSAAMMRWSKDPSFAWHAEMERGEIEWNLWKALFVRERAFREGGGWRESLRVNLSQGSRLLVLFAQWPENTSASEGRLEELLRAVALADPGQGRG